MAGEFDRAVGLVKGYINREWERINAVETLDARTELDIPSPRQSNTYQEELTVIVRDSAHARRILNVEEGADFHAIHAAYEKLKDISKPEQFASGTEEYTRAIRVQRSIHTAYSILIDEFSTTEKRFQSLEID